MKPIEELLKNLARTDVLEFGLVTNRLPSINVGGKFEPVDDEAPTTERVLTMLAALGGARHVESLGEKPVQWTARVDGVGVVAIAAIMRKDVVQARFTVARRDPQARPQGPQIRPVKDLLPQPPPTSPGPSAAKSEPRMPAVIPGKPVPQSSPRLPAQRVSVPPPPPPPQGAPAVVPAAVAPPAPPAPAPAPPPPTSASAKAAPVAAIPPEAASSSDEWADDDDEPTVQTLSPPLAQSVPPPASPPGSKEARSVPSPPAKSAAKPGAAPEPPPAAPAVPVALSAERVEPAPPSIIEESRPPALEAAPAPPPVRPRRDTPTNVDDDVTGEHSAPAKLKLDLGDEDEDGNTVELGPGAADVRPSASTIENVPSASPSVTPPVAGDRVRGDATLDTYLAMAVTARASDLHLIAGRPLVLRIASDLLQRTHPVSPEGVERIAREIIPERLRAAFERDGSCDFSLEHPQYGRFRVNVSKQRTGLKLSMRVVPREIPSLAQLGLPASLASVARESGLVLVTGSIGHGKTTTVAALVDVINLAGQQRVVVVEDPVEFVHPRKRAFISYREVGTHAHSTHRAVEAALAEDPDVVVIGEIRDAETARAAFSAAESGHLVLATMSASSAARAVERLIEIFPPARHAQARASLARTLRLVVGQRLVPSADRTQLHAAIELLPASKPLQAAIRDSREHAVEGMQPYARAHGGLRLDESLADLVRGQLVTLEVAKHFAESAQDVEAMLARPAAARKA